jgi:hypothetical protein
VDGRRGALDQQGERFVDPRVGDQVVVVDDQHDRAIEVGQVVDQEQQPDVGRIGSLRGQRRQRASSDPGLEASQRLGQIGDQARCVVVDLVHRAPRDGWPVLGSYPLGEQRRLAEPGRCGDERQSM